MPASILVAFDNILDTTDAINVNVDQKGLGELWGKWLVDHVPNGGKVLEVRGVAGTSVDTDRHNGIHKVLDASGKKWDVVEVVGKWDDGTAQKATADAIAVQGHFDGITAQGGDTGVVQAMIDAKHAVGAVRRRDRERLPQVLRRPCSQDGLDLHVGGHRPGPGRGRHQDGASTRSRARSIPQSVRLPLAIVADPDFKDGENYYADQSDNFFVGNSFPTCGINFTAQEIMGQTKDDK